MTNLTCLLQAAAAARAESDRAHQVLVEILGVGVYDSAQVATFIEELACSGRAVDDGDVCELLQQINREGEAG